MSGDASLPRRVLRDALQAALGPEPGLAVIHSSLPDLGPAQPLSRWDALFAIDAVVRAGWTVALPAFTFSFCHGTPFDAMRSPSEVGVLADWVRESVPGALRTRCPIYSFQVLGPQAEALAALRAETVWGRGSVFEAAEEQDARIVMLGCDWSFCTQFHRYEEQAAVPYRHYKRFEGPADFGDGVVAASASMYLRDLAVAPQRNEWRQITARIRESQLVRTVPVWRGAIEVVSAKALATATRDLLAEQPLGMVKEPALVAHRLAVRKRAAEQPPVRVAVLGHSTIDLLASSLRDAFEALGTDRRLEIFTVPFGQVRQQISDLGSALNSFRPELALFSDRLEDLLGEAWAERDGDELDGRVADYAALVRKFHETQRGWSIVHRFPHVDWQPDAARNSRVGELVDRFNAELHDALTGLDRLVWVDPAQEALLAGRPVSDDRLWRAAKIPYSQEFSRHLAVRWCGALLAMLGKTTRLIAVDLDNTLWGGVLGEDGLDGLQLGGDYPGNAFRAFHDALRALTRQGIAVAVCSKNEERLALEAMDHHPDMRIRPADLVAHRINWKPKSVNLRDICTELNLGIESVLFVDDNPVERDEVRRALPGVKVLDLPEDPSDYARCLLASPWVASVQHTHEDTARLRNYRTRRRVEHERETTADFTEFLISLGMTVYLQPLDDTNSVRAEQLCQKTNQFNSTTRRYTRRELETIRSTGGEVVVIGLEDRYTERENVGVLVLLPAQDDPRTGIIDLYLLSCRVLGRGLETALVSWACRHLGARGHREVRAQVVETERNAPVRDVYAGAGFAATRDGWWVCRPDDVVEAPDWITWVDLMPNTQSAS